MLCRHFSSMNLILSFPGVCYQFSSLFTVRSCVLQLYDTQCSISIILSMVTEKALAYGKQHYHTLQASESALIIGGLSNKSHPLSFEKEASSRCTCTIDVWDVVVSWECLAVTFWICMTFNSVGNQCRPLFYFSHNSRQKKANNVRSLNKKDVFHCSWYLQLPNCTD